MLTFKQYELKKLLVDFVSNDLEQVTKKMVGSGNDIEADMPLMDIGASSALYPKQNSLYCKVPPVASVVSMREAKPGTLLCRVVMFCCLSAIGLGGRNQQHECSALSQQTHQRVQGDWKLPHGHNQNRVAGPSEDVELPTTLVHASENLTAKFAITVDSL